MSYTTRIITLFKSRESLQTFICHCYYIRGRSKSFACCHLCGLGVATKILGPLIVARNGSGHTFIRSKLAMLIYPKSDRAESFQESWLGRYVTSSLTLWRISWPHVRHKLCAATWLPWDFGQDFLVKWMSENDMFSENPWRCKKTPLSVALT